MRKPRPAASKAEAPQRRRVRIAALALLVAAALAAGVWIALLAERRGHWNLERDLDLWVDRRRSTAAFGTVSFALDGDEAGGTLQFVADWRQPPAAILIHLPEEFAPAEAHWGPQPLARRPDGAWVATPMVDAVQFVWRRPPSAQFPSYANTVAAHSTHVANR